MGTLRSTDMRFRARSLRRNGARRQCDYNKSFEVSLDDLGDLDVDFHHIFKQQVDHLVLVSFEVALNCCDFVLSLRL